LGCHLQKKRPARNGTLLKSVWGMLYVQYASLRMTYSQEGYFLKRCHYSAVLCL